MDPEAALAEAERAFAAGDRPTTLTQLRAYWEWRDRGGFEPPHGDQRARALALAYARALRPSSPWWP
jgi:hypothetical protein